MTTKRIFTLLDAVLIDGTSPVVDVGDGRRTLSASIAGSGAVSGTVTWYGSHTSSGAGVIVATSTLSGTTTDITGADVPAEWPYMYCVLSALTGTSAAVTAIVSA